METKKCTKCKKVLPISEFYKNRSTKDGLSRWCKDCTRIMQVWANMLQRCNNSKNTSYKNYGGRGISVCKAWENNFKVFEEWALNNGYNGKLTLDRIDNDGNYEPGNCRFSTCRMQSINQRMSKTNTSGYVGVFLHSDGAGWEGKISVYNKTYCSGYSTDKLKAVKMRDDYIKKNKLDNKLNLI